ncbi:Gfo/Idh/MocA family protein [Gemmatimonas sp.]|uniref:Gfo/Idh/MocA family protein n=1 Tax=Gemmatimonas sp. TaxID=1962908 RepID=UPI003DA40991
MSIRDSVVQVGLLGAGAWAQFAHLPGYIRDPRCKVVAIADPIRERAEAFAKEFNIPRVYTSHEELIARHDLDAVDVCTPSATHFALSWAALESGKHVLCEKPVAYDYQDTRRAAALAVSKGLKTKVGFTFRYSPAMRYMKSLIDEGFIGEPFIFNGHEQNSQWLDPQNPLRQVDHTADQSIIHVSSLEGVWGADHGYRPSVHGEPVRAGGGDHEELHPGAHGARDGNDDAHEHRRWRHLHR